GGEAATILCFRATTLALVAWSFTRGLGLRGLVWALALSPVLALVLGGALLRAAAQPGDGVTAPGPLALLAMAFPLAVNGGLALLSMRVELLALGTVVDDYTTGLFAAALKLVDSLVLVPAAIATGAMPALTREAVAGGAAARERTAGTVALLGVPASI